MTFAGALAQAQVLKTALLDHKVKSVSIELVVGRPGGPNGGWWTNTFIGTLGHHIVSRRNQGLTPFLWLIKQGRTDLPGPICNGYGGFDEVARIICMGWANHPGLGGPRTLELGTIPANNGRPYLFGWEFEGGVNVGDWPESMHVFMARCLAGSLDYVSTLKNRTLTEKSHLEHKNWAEPPGRKVDRLGYSLDQARTLIARELNQPTEDEMTPLQARLEVAAAWYQRAGVWMDPSGDENPQARLTRLANEVVTGQRTVAEIVQYIGKIRDPAPGEALPAWVLDPTQPYAAPIYGGNATSIPAHNHDARYVVKGNKTITLS